MAREGGAAVGAGIARLGRWSTLSALFGSQAASLLTGAVDAAVARLRSEPATRTAAGLIEFVVTDVLVDGLATALVALV